MKLTKKEITVIDNLLCMCEIYNVDKLDATREQIKGMVAVMDIIGLEVNIVGLYTDLPTLYTVYVQKGKDEYKYNYDSDYYTYRKEGR